MLLSLFLDLHMYEVLERMGGCAFILVQLPTFRSRAWACVYDPLSMSPKNAVVSAWPAHVPGPLASLKSLLLLCSVSLRCFSLPVLGSRGDSS